MNEARARELLGSSIRDDGLTNVGWYLGWSHGRKEATLDGEFTADDLEAIAYWMRRPPVEAIRAKNQLVVDSINGKKG